MSEYIDALNELRDKNIKQTKKLEREIAGFYYRSYQRYTDQLKTVKSGSMNEVWLHNQRKAVAKQLEDIGRRTEGVIDGMMETTIYRINKETEDFFNKAAKEGGLPEDLFTGMYTSMNDSIIRELKSGKMYKDGVGLSSRIWNHNKSYDKGMKDVIEEGIMDKLSPYDIAKNLEGYLNPDTRKDGKYPKNGKGKNVEYNSYRLANTSISHSYQLALSRVNSTNPFINGLEWEGGHESTSCDICKGRRGKVYGANRNQGVKFTTEPAPFDHPNGFCKLIPYIPDSLEDIGSRLNKWATREEGSDPVLDKWFKEHGQKYKGPKDLKVDIRKKEDQKPPKPTEPKETKPKKPKEKVGTDKWFDKNFKRMKDQLPADVWGNIKKALSGADPDLLEWYRQGDAHFTFGGRSAKGNAFYSPRDKLIMQDLYRDNRVLNVFFHEYAHLVDDLLGTEKNGTRLTDTYIDLYDIMLKDVDNLKKVSASAKMWEMKPDVADRQANSKITNELKGNKGHLIAGVSDIMSGLTQHQIKGNWTHPLEYWNRQEDKRIDVVSEAIANMSEAWAIPEVGEYMDKYFPEGFKYFKEVIVKETIEKKGKKKK